MSTPDVIWYTRCPVPTALSVAAGLGWVEREFAAEGVQLRSLAASGDPGVRNAHFHQGQPHLIRHGGNVPVLVARSRGADVRVVATSWTDFHEPVLVLPESGITRVDDLRGRRIGVPRRLSDGVDWWRPTVLHGFARALATVGLTLDDVEHVDIPIDRAYIEPGGENNGHRASLWDALRLLGQQREEAVALLTRQVDALFSHATLAANLRGFTGARVLVDVGAAPDRQARVNNGVPQVLTVTGDLLDGHPTLVARVLARVLQAAEWARANRDAALAIVAAEVGLPQTLVDVAYSDRAVAQLDIALTEESIRGLEAQAQWLSDGGFLASPVDVDRLVDPRPLKAARDLLAAFPQPVH